MTENSIASRVAEVRQRIAAAAERAGRRGHEVSVVAVAKTFPAAVVIRALHAGVDAVGENRAQELLAKRAELAEAGTPYDRWHFVGRVQRNKVKKLAPHVEVWHSVDRVAVGEAIAHHAPGARVYVQVNLGGEEQKGGCAPREVPGLLDSLVALGLSAEGLMTVPPLGEDPRPHFARLRDLAGRHGVAGLSMGMSADFETAVEEGATLVRLGTVIFGPRET